MNSPVVMKARVRATTIGHQRLLLAAEHQLAGQRHGRQSVRGGLCPATPNTTGNESMHLPIGQLREVRADGTTQAMEATNLLWTLYNKVDFIFNY